MIQKDSTQDRRAQCVRPNWRRARGLNSHPLLTAEPAVRSNILCFDGGTSRMVFASLTPMTGRTTVRQFEDLLRQLDDLLAAHGVTRQDIAKQNVFLRSAHTKATIRRRLRTFCSGALPVTNYILQPPAEGHLVAMEILAIKGEQVRIDKRNEHLTIVSDDDCRWAYVGGVEPARGERDTYRQALDCFRQMHRHLRRAGFHFDQVVRTWIYERNIIATELCACGERRQRYQIMNDARRQFFTHGNSHGPFSFFHDLPPASTGIGMSAGRFVMECLALDVAKDKIEVTPLNNPEQIDAHAYSQDVLLRGAAAIKAAPLFSRGMSINKDYRMLLISGTASIKGQTTVCLKDPVGQTRTTLENIALVLGQADASLRDIQQARVYVKSDASPRRFAERVAAIKSVVEATLPGIPKLYLVADVCRENLLVEIEALSFVSNGAKRSSRSHQLTAQNGHHAPRPADVPSSNGHTRLER